MRAVLHGLASQPWLAAARALSFMRRWSSRSFAVRSASAPRRIILVAFLTASVNAGSVAWASPEIGRSTGMKRCISW